MSTDTSQITSKGKKTNGNKSIVVGLNLLYGNLPENWRDTALVCSKLWLDKIVALLSSTLLCV